MAGWNSRVWCSGRVARMLAAGALATLALLASAAVAGAVGGRVITVSGVVVHRAPLLDRYAIIGPRGHLLPIFTRKRVPPVGHRVVVRLRLRGGVLEQIGYRLGPATRAVRVTGVVTYVYPRGRHFAVSDGFNSILVLHRLRGRLPRLHDRVAVRARLGAHGRLIEQRLVDQRNHRDTIRLAGFLKYLILPTQAPVLTQTQLLSAGSCANGCAVITADDAGQSTSADLIPIPLPASTATLASVRGVSDATTSRKSKTIRSVAQALKKSITTQPTAPISLNDTQPTAPAPDSSPPIITTGTIIITGPPTPSSAPTSPPAPVIIAPPTCPSGQSPVEPGNTCQPNCPAGQDLVQTSSTGPATCEPNLSSGFDPVQLPPPKVPPSVCQNPGSFFLSQHANGLQCENNNNMGLGPFIGLKYVGNV